MLGRLRLPDETPRMLKFNMSQFQRYSMGRTNQEKNNLGVAMRLASRGILEFDISVSIGYQPVTGTVNAFLHGCTSTQQEEIANRVKTLSPLARHPLLLPTILAEMRFDAIKEQGEYIWRFLLDVETRSGQTGAPALHAPLRPVNGTTTDWGKLAVDALAVMQIAATMEDHANGLQLVLEEMHSILQDMDQEAHREKNGFVLQTGRLVLEKVRSLSQRTRLTVSWLQYIIKRGEAQQSAVSPYLYTLQCHGHILLINTKQGLQLHGTTRCPYSGICGSSVRCDRTGVKTGQFCYEGNSITHYGVPSGNFPGCM